MFNSIVKCDTPYNSRRKYTDIQATNIYFIRPVTNEISYYKSEKNESASNNVVGEERSNDWRVEDIH